MMKLIYLGHSAFQFVGETFNIIIDPYISDNQMCSVSVDQLTEITDIFITHGHGDHLGDVIKIAKQNDANIYCNSEVSWYLSSLSMDLKCNPFYFGSFIECPFGKVKMIPALHGSGIKINGLPIYAGAACGYLFDINKLKLYHAGDTALFLDMKLLADEKIDVAILPIGGTYTMGIDEAMKAIDYIKPKTVIPMHYNTFNVIKTDPIEFARKVKTCKVKVLNIDDFIEV